MKAFRKVLVLTLTMGIVAYAGAQDEATSNPYRFGGSCASQGVWTQRALKASQDIESAIEGLRDYKDCQGITKVLENFKAKRGGFDQNLPSGETGSEQEATEAIPGDIGDIASGVTDPAIKNEASSLLVQKLLQKLNLDSKAKVTGVKKRIKNAASNGISLFNQLITELPNYETCIESAPDPSAVLFGGMITMAGSLTSANGEGLVTDIGRSVGTFLNFLRRDKFNKVMRKLYQSEYWASISCIIESTTENYCSVKDAYEMLKFLEKESDLRTRVKEEARSGKISSNPLEGYFILEREVAIVSEWLGVLQFGVEPKTKPVASYKNTVLSNYNNYQQDKNTLLAAFYDTKRTMGTFNDADSKKNIAFSLVQTLVRNLQSSGGEWTPDGGGNVVNFFSSAVQSNLIPFYLIGLDEIPVELRNTKENSIMKVDWDQWMQSSGVGGGYQPQFNDPDELMRIIKVRLDAILAKALVNASRYFQKMFIVDMESLVNETIISQTISVYQAFKNIDRYLTNVLNSIPKNSSAQTPEDRIIVPSIYSTQLRIQEVLNSYEGLMNLGSRYLGASKEDVFNHIRQDLEWAKKDGVKDGMTPRLRSLFGNQSFAKAFSAVIESAFNSFNVLLQMDSFLYTRLGTIVRYDFTKRIKNVQDNTYQKDLLIITSKNLIDRMREAASSNIDLVRNDLAQAQVINTRNLSALEDLFSVTLMPIVMESKLVAENRLSSQDVRNERDKMNRTNACLAVVIDAKDTQITNGKMYRECMDYVSQDGIVRLFSLLGAGQSVRYDPEMAKLFTYDHQLNDQQWRNNGAFDDLINLGQKRNGYSRTYDDPNGSFARYRNKLCLQSLAFNSSEYYFSLCDGVFMQSYSPYKTESDAWSGYVRTLGGPHVVTTKGLNNFSAYVDYTEKNRGTSYSGMFKRLVFEGDIEKKKEWKDQNVCALRSHIRRNYVYWLTKFNNDQQSTELTY